MGAWKRRASIKPLLITWEGSPSRERTIRIELICLIAHPLFCSDAPSKRPAPQGLLARIVFRQRLDRRVIQLRGHAPHISDGIRIAPRLPAEILQLRHQVVAALAGEARELRLPAVAVGSVAGAAYPDGKPL